MLTVEDAGPGFLRVSSMRPDSFAVAGRGLFTVAALAEELSVARSPTGGARVRVRLHPGTI